MDVVKQHDSRVTVEVDGEDLGTWDQFSAPSAGSETGTYRPGGSRHAVATRGLPTMATGTATRAMTRDNADRIHRRLLPKRGVARMKVIDQPLDLASGTPWGQPTIYTGILSQVAVSEYNADGNDNRTVELTIQPDTRTA